MDARLLSTLALRRWTTLDGASLRVFTEPGLAPEELGRYEGYAPSILEMLGVARSISLASDKGPRDDDLRIAPPPLGPGEPLEGAGFERRFGSLWLRLDAGRSESAFLLEARLGAVIHFESEARRVRLLGRSPERFLREWLAVRSREALVPKPRSCGARLGAVRAGLEEPLAAATARLPDRLELLSFEGARFGSAFEIDDRPLERLPGALAWVREPRRRSLWERIGAALKR